MFPESNIPSSCSHSFLEKDGQEPQKGIENTLVLMKTWIKYTLITAAVILFFVRVEGNQRFGPMIIRAAFTEVSGAVYEIVRNENAPVAPPAAPAAAPVSVAPAPVAAVPAPAAPVPAAGPVVPSGLSNPVNVTGADGTQVTGRWLMLSDGRRARHPDSSMSAQAEAQFGGTFRPVKEASSGQYNFLQVAATPAAP